jgi:hypothetical protein
LISSKKWRLALFVVFGIALIHAACFAIVYLPYGLHGYSDFTILYTAGTVINTGHAAQLYDSQTQWDVQQNCCSVPTRQAPLLFNHAPYEAILFAPVARLPYGVAYIVWLAVNMGILLLVAFVLRDYLRPLLPRWWLLPLAALAWVPVFLALVQGQDSLLLALFYALAFVCLKRGSPFLAGACIALAGSKPQLVLPFVIILALRRQWKAVLGFVSTGAALVLVSAFVIGWNAIFGYPGFLLKFSRLPAEISAAAPFKMPNLRGIILKLLDFGAAAPIRTLAVVLVSAAVVWMAARFKGVLEEEFSMMIVATLLVSYHLYFHDVSVLLVAAIVVAGRLRSDRRVRILFAAGTVPWVLLAASYHLTAHGALCLYAAFLAAFGAAVWGNAKSVQVQENQVPAIAST